MLEDHREERGAVIGEQLEDTEKDPGPENPVGKGGTEGVSAMKSRWRWFMTHTSEEPQEGQGDWRRVSPGRKLK